MSREGLHTCLSPRQIRITLFPSPHLCGLWPGDFPERSLHVGTVPTHSVSYEMTWSAWWFALKIGVEILLFRCGNFGPSITVNIINSEHNPWIYCVYLKSDASYQIFFATQTAYPWHDSLKTIFRSQFQRRWLRFHSCFTKLKTEF